MARYIWQGPDWPRWRWSEAVLADTLSAAQRKQDFLAGLAQGLDGDHLNFAIAEFTTRETVSTSAIEGVKLDPDEVRSSIMRRLVGPQTLRGSKTVDFLLRPNHDIARAAAPRSWVTHQRAASACILLG